MPELHHLIGFCALSLGLSVLPGPAVLFIVGRALTGGRRAALASVLGSTIGGYLLVVAVALGLGSLVQASALLFTTVKLAGAAYLIGLGIKSLRASRNTPPLDTAVSPPPSSSSTGRQIRQGIVVGVSNPKSILFLAAVLPQFVSSAPAAGPVPAQMMILGLAGALLQATSDSIWGLTASAARTWLGRSRRRTHALNATGSIAMIGLGVTIAATE